jgi:prepilin-type N-terminal cleavage/methylation domain-containing protein
MVHPHSTLAGDRGFTLVEVMVAVTLLVVGALGTITMVTGANTQTVVTKDREGAVNLEREIIDAARGVDYDSLTQGGVVPALQAQPGLSDSDDTVAGWQVSRRSEVYTVSSMPICVVDGQADGYGAHPTPSDPAAPGYCSGQTAGTADANPDDFRRMDVTITWSVAGRDYSLRDTTLIINPSGGIGPTVKSLCRINTGSEAACPANPISGSVTSGTSMSFLALTSAADTTTWTVDDGSPPVDVSSSNPAAPAGTAWNFTWNLGTAAVPASYTCGMNVNWTLDGNYIVTAQGISGIGANAVPGPLRRTARRRREPRGRGGPRVESEPGAGRRRLPRLPRERRRLGQPDLRHHDDHRIPVRVERLRLHFAERLSGRQPEEHQLHGGLPGDRHRPRSHHQQPARIHRRHTERARRGPGL